MFRFDLRLLLSNGVYCPDEIVGVSFDHFLKIDREFDLIFDTLPCNYSPDRRVFLVWGTCSLL